MRKVNVKLEITIKDVSEAILIDYGIDRVKYHGGELEGMSIQHLFQNTKKIFNDFSFKIKLILKLQKNDKETEFVLKTREEIDGMIRRFVKVCILFDNL